MCWVKASASCARSSSLRISPRTCSRPRSASARTQRARGCARTPRNPNIEISSGSNPMTKITVEATVAAPIEQVWGAYTNPEDIRQWNAASDDWHTTKATVDLRVGGAFSSRMEAKDGSVGFDFAGIYTKIVEHKLIEYSFGDSAARVEFTPDGRGGVTVRVTFESESTHTIEQQRSGWQAILDNFARHVQASKAGRAVSGGTTSRR